ncbi:MAG: hypothetical protein VW405_06555 [Rhodospirillaceae bacterium]
MNTLIVYWSGLWRQSLTGLGEHPSTENTPAEWAAFQRALLRKPRVGIARIATR